MSAASLCSGAGVLDVVAHRLTGHDLAWYCETDPAASLVMARHWPDVTNHGDITAIDWSQLEPVEVLTAGYPCQPFSHAGRRRGTTDVRHLWPYVFGAVRALRPRLVFLENVAGHLSLGFDRVLADLASIGFDAEWGVLRASDVGACHARARLWVVAYPHSPGTGGESGCLPVPIQGRAGEQLHAAVDAGAALLPTPTAWLGRRPVQSEGDPERWANPARSRELSDCIAWLRSRDVNLLPTPTTNDARNGRSRSAGRTVDPLPTTSIGTMWGDYAPAIARHEQVMGTPAPSPTVVGTKGKPVLSPVFVEWMMMFPEGWVTASSVLGDPRPSSIARTAALRILGNAPVGACAFAAYAQLLERAPSLLKEPDE